MTTHPLFHRRAFNRTLTAAAVAIAGIVFSSAALAEPAAHWDKQHPRRAEVNARLDRQNHRINQEVKEGELSKGQAAKLHHEDHQVRQEERAMASQDGGHITRTEQAALNQQENHISRQIGN